MSLISSRTPPINSRPKSPRLLSIAVLLLIVATSAQADRVVEHEGATITFHDQPIENIAAQFSAPQPLKIDVSGNWLILPHYEVNLLNANGVNTLYAVRNTTSSQREIGIAYNPQIGSAILETVILGPKEVKSFSLRNVPGLVGNSNGIARGYVSIADNSVVTSPLPSSLIQGDYFIINPFNNFASGDRLINNTGLFAYNDLCSRFEVRFFNGGGFDGGTDISFYFDRLVEDSIDLIFAVYTEAGGAPVETGTVDPGARSIKLPIAALTDVPFGVIEFTFTNGSGHVSSVFSALGKFSVGLNALCHQGPILTP